MISRNSTTEVARLTFSDKQAVLERLRLQRGAENSVDGAKILSEWLESLDELMTRLRTWLSDAENEGLITVVREAVDRDERIVGHQ